MDAFTALGDGKFIGCMKDITKPPSLNSLDDSLDLLQFPATTSSLRFFSFFEIIFNSPR